MASSDLSSTSPARLALQHFTSQWFLIPQGTGITAVILHQLDYQFRGLQIVSYVFWIMTIVLLLCMVLVYIVRCIRFPRQLAGALRHDIGELACLTSIVISFTSIIQMTSLVLVPGRGSSKGWGVAVYVLWWINAALATVGAIGVPFVFVRLYPGGIPHLSPASQLPLIAALTAAAGGGTLCQSAGLSAALQVPVIVVSYLLVGMGLPLAFALDVLFWARLLDRSLPNRQHVYQDMILCGPWGQGSFALQGLGAAVLRGSFASYARSTFITAEAAKPVGYVSIFAGLLAWGTGTFWWIFAIVSILHAATDHWRFRVLPFDLSTWAVVFPWGVYTNAAVQLGKLLDSAAFKVWSTALAVMLVAIWLLNMVLTIRGVVTGSLFGLEHGWRSGAAHGGKQDAERGEARPRTGKVKQ
ncbi:voltage-dependent anion channel [Chaetomium strumarium]|uniref:Sulfite efflux pump SSU1 n=1 Tax=Chaetomium strumarium TaxID=1170767 RepID=A0AAJ0GUD8_9PEZI|nr:voltage-dependent anion channel [Chaetomium strumarium]